MRVARGSIAAVSDHAGRIYCIGGRSGSAPTATVEVDGPRQPGKRRTGLADMLGPPPVLLAMLG